MDKTSLGDRMKGYENIERRYLPKRAPVIIRIDGAHFHTVTRGCERPFDKAFRDAMNYTMFDLCRNIMGAKLGYTQSDEISLLLTDDDTIETQGWFDKNLQKIVSTSAAMTTLYFNRYWSSENGAYFDSRAFVLPREEVMNYFEWRQQDCVRNSIQSVGQAYFSHKQLNGKSCGDIQNMLFTEHGVNWNDYAPSVKRGVCARKVDGVWTLDDSIPIFHNDPDYINNLVYHKEANITEMETRLNKC